MTALSILRLVQPPGEIHGGPISFNGRSDLLELSERDMRAIRGAEIGFIFQEPMTALNPVFTIGDQIAEALRVHGKATRSGARAKAIELLEAVRIPDPARRLRDYPHQLSGGMRQRVLIAIALACQPLLLIADEPTTALDVTIQAEILDLLQEMKEKFHLALLLITHDLGVVAGHADRVAVMYAGRIVEEGPMRQIFDVAEASVHAGPARVDSGRRARPAPAAPSKAPCQIWRSCRRVARSSPDARIGSISAPPRRRRPTTSVLASARAVTSTIRGAADVLRPFDRLRPLVEVRHLVKQFSRREGFLTQAEHRPRGQRRELHCR